MGMFDIPVKEEDRRLLTMDEAMYVMETRFLNQKIVDFTLVENKDKSRNLTLVLENGEVFNSVNLIQTVPKDMVIFDE